MKTHSTHDLLCNNQNLKWGRITHAKAVECGNDSNIYVLTAIIHTYKKCSSMAEAQGVFYSILKPDVVLWTTLLSGYLENGEPLIVLDLFYEMKRSGCMPNSFTYVAALKACSSLEASHGKGHFLEYGRTIHAEVGTHMNQYVQSVLIDMYGKGGCIEDAHNVFDSMHNPDVVSWNALLLGYAENGKASKCLDLLCRMKAEGRCLPNSVTYIACLKACTNIAASVNVNEKTICLERGRQIHSEIGFHLNHYVQNTLIDMYSKCESMIEAHAVFDKMQKPDVVSWNTLILGYAETGEGFVALDLFSQMKHSGCTPNSFTYVSALKACTSLLNENGTGKQECLRLGREIHVNIGSHFNHYVGNTLIDLYAKCGVMTYAREVFEIMENTGLVSWNALILGYADNGQGKLALELFSRMKASGYVPDSMTYVAALMACKSLAVAGKKRDSLELGKMIHLEIGSYLNNYVGNTLIDMYSSCGSMVNARLVFDKMQNPDVVCWNVFLLGYVDNGDGYTVLDLFSKMKASGCVPEVVTYISVLKACGLIGALTLGRKFHSEINTLNGRVLTCLVDFYAKCGSLAEARQVFDMNPKARDITTWTALLAGYATIGDTASVFNLLEAMQDVGLQPDGVTSVCVLLCCSHAGLVEKAREYLEAMTLHYQVTPTIVHYNCILDAMGRSNQLQEAMRTIRNMPCNPDALTWITLLGACRKWKNVMVGRVAFQALTDTNNLPTSAYVLMSHIYKTWE